MKQKVSTRMKQPWNTFNNFLNTTYDISLDYRTSEWFMEELSCKEKDEPEISAADRGCHQRLLVDFLMNCSTNPKKKQMLVLWSVSW